MFSIFLIIYNINSHMEMVDPAPRRSKHNPDYLKSGDIDYELINPLGSTGGYNYPFPCKTPKNELNNSFPVYKSYEAGSQIPIKLGGSTPHNGGHCEFSISYDQGKTFVVLKTIIGECMLDGARDYTVNLPNTIPGGKAVFAWTWINRIGNREYYMNCADIEIINKNKKEEWYLKGPKLFIGNLPGYPTIPEFSVGDNLTGSQHYINRDEIIIRNTDNVVDPYPTKKPTDPSPVPTESPDNKLPPNPLPSIEPTPIPNPEKCTLGENKCDGEKFKTCVNETWVIRECDDNETCHEVGNSIYCA